MKRNMGIIVHGHGRCHPGLVDLSDKEVSLQDLRREDTLLQSGPVDLEAYVPTRDGAANLVGADGRDGSTVERKTDLDVLWRDPRKDAVGLRHLVKTQVGFKNARFGVQAGQVIANAGARGIRGLVEMGESIGALLGRFQLPGRHVDGAVSINADLALGDPFAVDRCGAVALLDISVRNVLVVSFQHVDGPDLDGLVHGQRANLGAGARDQGGRGDGHLPEHCRRQPRRRWSRRQSKVGFVGW